MDPEVDQLRFSIDHSQANQNMEDLIGAHVLMFLEQQKFKALVEPGDKLLSPDILDDATDFVRKHGDFFAAMQEPSSPGEVVEIGPPTDETPPSRAPVHCGRKAFLFGAQVLKTLMRYAPPLGTRATVHVGTYAVPLALGWNMFRKMAGSDGPAREGAEFAAALFIAAVVPDAEGFSSKVAASLVGYPEFEGDVGALKESIYMVISSMAGSAGVTPAVIITNLSETHAAEWLIAGWSIAFFLIAVASDLTALGVGKEMVVRRGDGSFSDTVKSAAKKAVTNYSSMDTLVRARIPYVVAHYAHHTYADRLVKLARNGQEYGALLGTAVFIFFASFKIIAAATNYAADRLKLGAAGTPEGEIASTLEAGRGGSN
ncbi:hypothetical protein ACCS93_33330 [Rhizobium ruizarguesonis]